MLDWVHLDTMPIHVYDPFYNQLIERRSPGPT